MLIRCSLHSKQQLFGEVHGTLINLRYQPDRGYDSIDLISIKTHVVGHTVREHRDASIV